MDDWKRLEQIVCNIQRTVAPNAVVTHNERVLGRSKQRRQLDVTVRQTVGLEDLLIVIECKDLQRPVTIKEVEQFIGLFEDVSASRGVMVSSSGYTKGARAKAAEQGIRLLSYLDATTLDWSSFFGEDTRFYFVVTTLKVTEVVTFVDEEEDEPPLDATLGLRTSEGDFMGTLESVIDPLKRAIYGSRTFPLGEYTCEVDLGATLVLETHDGPRTIERIELILNKSARTYTTRPQIESGHVLLDDIRGTTYQDFAHRTNWAEITEREPGIPMTPEEYAACNEKPASELPYHVEMTDEDGILSVRLRDKNFREPPREHGRQIRFQP
jgi:hypothetical protein